MIGRLKKKAAAVIRTPVSFKWISALFACLHFTVQLRKGWSDEGGRLQERGEKERHFREGGEKNKMHTLLISKRKSCLKSGRLAVLAANATRRLRNTF